MQASDLDNFAKTVKEAGVDLESDHPGFNDKEYRWAGEACPDAGAR